MKWSPLSISLFLIFFWTNPVRLRQVPRFWVSLSPMQSGLWLLYFFFILVADASLAAGEDGIEGWRGLSGKTFRHDTFARRFLNHFATCSWQNMSDVSAKRTSCPWSFVRQTTLSSKTWSDRSTKRRPESPRTFWLRLQALIWSDRSTKRRNKFWTSSDRNTKWRVDSPRTCWLRLQALISLCRSGTHVSNDRTTPIPRALTLSGSQCPPCASRCPIVLGGHRTQGASQGSQCVPGSRHPWMM